MENDSSQLLGTMGDQQRMKSKFKKGGFILDEGKSVLILEKSYWTIYDLKDASVRLKLKVPYFVCTADLSHFSISGDSKTAIFSNDKFYIKKNGNDGFVPLVYGWEEITDRKNDDLNFPR